MSIMHAQSTIVAAVADGDTQANITARTLVDVRADATAFCQLNLTRAGVYQAFTSNNSIPPGTEWYDGPVTNPGNFYYARLQGTGDSPDTGTLDTWLNINVTRTWRWESVLSGDSRGFTGTLDIGINGGSDIVASAAVSITAERL